MRNRLYCCVVVLYLLAVPHVHADITLPKVIASHMVLQRDRPLPIWGWADAGEDVTVNLDEATATAKADTQGNWKVVLPAVQADGKAHRMIIRGKNRIELEDILFGEVWIGSGQSNMEWDVIRCHNAQKAIPAATDTKIRLLQVAKILEPHPAKDIGGPGWQVCSPQTVRHFSGVLYFFGQRLRRDLNIPVGLIHASWGGSAIEPWIATLGKDAARYNGMIAPLCPFAIRGATWYQGESNRNNGLRYAEKMNALIGGWRQVWGYDFPFYFVQIAPYAGYQPGVLPPLWEAQVASLKIPGTGMVVTTDLVGNLKEIHPGNKLDVGNRLALWALVKDYKKDLVYSGPLYKAMRVEGDRIRLYFAHVGGGLKSRDGKLLTEFEIAGADARFVPAEAAIDGNTVIVRAREVRDPTQARFGWRNEAIPNLVNQDCLPASPFQTNDWQGGTGE